MAIHDQLDYPVLDGDGHVLELAPVFADFCRDHGAGHLADRSPLFGHGNEGKRSRAELTPEEMRSVGLLPLSWHTAADAEYLASCSLPKRYYDHLYEAGIDYSVLYPTMGLQVHRLIDDEERVELSRLYNMWMAEQYAPYQDRFTIAAAIPAHTPDEAIAEMERAKKLGAKVAMIPSHVRRPMPGRQAPDASLPRPPAPWAPAGWLDTFGLDSAYDYDPMWAKAVELGFPLGSHSSGMGMTDRSSVNNYLYNQIGHFGAVGSALTKSLFLGGVTKRFPELRLALLEGGVAPGVQVFIGLVSSWKKRGSYTISRLNPANIDRELFAKLVEESAPELAAKYSADDLVRRGLPQVHDDFELTGVKSEEDIVRQFTKCFIWGCEADDALLAMSVDPKILPLGAKVPAFFGSDIGHWDVEHFDEPLEEAYELIEHGIVDDETLRDFLFVNAARYLTEANPDFFKGTVIEKEVREAVGTK